MNVRTVSLITGLVTGLSLAPCALAFDGCTNSYLNGNYALQFTGVSAPGVASGIGGVAVPASLATSFQQDTSKGSSVVAPVAGAARLILDGSGNISGYSAENMAGNWIQGNITGTYVVNTDCTFSFAIADAGGHTENFSGVLTGQSSTAMVLQTDPGTGVSGTLKSARGLCQTSDISGSFGLQYSGTSLPTNSAYSSVGVVTLDGQGNLTAAETRFSGGTSSQAQSSGTIIVNSDCSFTMALSPISGSGATMNFFGIASADNKQLLIVQSDAATAVTGTMSSQ
ncbi:MAG: hypothetical protein WBY44_20885 [Bryobacteraceae bacterium]|jgi:hypothetical protein